MYEPERLRAIRRRLESLVERLGDDEARVTTGMTETLFSVSRADGSGNYIFSIPIIIDMYIPAPQENGRVEA